MKVPRRYRENLRVLLLEKEILTRVILERPNLIKKKPKETVEICKTILKFRKCIHRLGEIDISIQK